MPELPEVETIRRELERDIVGKRVKAVKVDNLRSIRRHKSKKAFISRLEGMKVTDVDRRGKFLLVGLESGDVLVTHLRMSGQLLRAANKDKVPDHTHVIITFTQTGQLRFRDPRTFGEMFVTTPDELTQELPELNELGVDPVDTPISWTDFARMLMSHSVKLKTLLMDQKFIAGLGNIYSDEILFQAGLRHDRMSDALSTQEIRRLYRALVETLHDAIKYRGSTLSDQQYVDTKGRPGEYQDHHQVYDREGEPCSRCRAEIVREKFSNRSTFFCPQCQV